VLSLVHVVEPELVKQLSAAVATKYCSSCRCRCSRSNCRQPLSSPVQPIDPNRYFSSSSNEYAADSVPCLNGLVVALVHAQNLPNIYQVPKKLK
jgi:hypothetical protein